MTTRCNRKGNWKAHESQNYENVTLSLFHAAQAENSPCTEEVVSSGSKLFYSVIKAHPRENNRVLFWPNAVGARSPNNIQDKDLETFFIVLEKQKCRTLFVETFKISSYTS